MQLPKFQDTSLFDKAFTHRSYLNESRDSKESNERLEYLGDSILSFLVSSYIFKKFPSLKEGELTALRASLINTNTLYQVAKDLNLGTYLKLSKGEEASGGRSNKTTLANTFEAYIGALYLDQGQETTYQFIEKVLLDRIDEITKDQGLKDPKSILQEITQDRFKVSPVYQILEEQGPDHAKTYTSGVFVKEKLLAKGKGPSKQDAEKNAAREAVAQISKSSL